MPVAEKWSYRGPEILIIMSPVDRGREAKATTGSWPQAALAANARRLMPGFQAHIAQSVEHFLGKEEVTGSNPVVGSISCS
jgi:hypothetical protein